MEARARVSAEAHRGPFGRDSQEVLAPGGVRRVRVDRSTAGDARPPCRPGRGVRLGGVLSLLFPLPGGWGRARQPPAPAAVAFDVAPQPGARRVGHRLDAQGLRLEAAGSRAGTGGASRGVKILDRYLLREFLGYLVMGLTGFIAIFIVVDIFEKIDG